MVTIRVLWNLVRIWRGDVRRGKSVMLMEVIHLRRSARWVFPVPERLPIVKL
ncbi:hypothetical protein A2U01_0110094, partial [Trifolium medium]|nr:hypothetical protein [Trifolium medium]